MDIPYARRIVFYCCLAWGMFILLFGLSAGTAGLGATPFVLILAHLGIIPMMTHHYLRKITEGRMKEAWVIGIGFGVIGMILDALVFRFYFDQGWTYFSSWPAYVYLLMRVGLAPVTAKWLEPQLTT